MSDVVFGLESQSWSGYVEPGEWLFVRRLEVHGHKNELLRMAGGALQYAVSAAVDGGSAQAQNANAVKFSSLPVMLTFLLRDLLNDSFIRKWYWSNWHSLSRETRANAVARLLWDNAAYLPAITDSLIENRLLASVWEQLSHQSAGEIIRCLEAVSPACDTPTLTRVEDIPRPELERLISSRLDSISPRLRTWGEALQGVPMLDNRSRLAFALVAKAIFPRLLAQHAGIVEQLMYQHIHQSPSMKKIGPPARRSTVAAPTDDPDRDHRIDSGPISDSTDGDQRIEFDTTADAGDIPGAEIESAVENGFGEARPASASDLDRFSRESSYHQSFDAAVKVLRPSDDGKGITRNDNLRAGVTVPDSGLQENQNSELAEAGFFTMNGGLFYLVNPLSAERYQQLLQQDDITRSGWLWLFDLARRLTPVLDNPMLEFLADVAGYDRVDDLLELPPLSVIDRLESRLSVELAERDLWNRKLLSVPARVTVTTSHIDCYFSLESVRLEVRLAGLDINPGWVPWLGRVVTFHYGEVSDAASLA